MRSFLEFVPTVYPGITSTGIPDTRVHLREISNAKTLGKVCETVPNMPYT